MWKSYFNSFFLITDWAVRSLMLAAVKVTQFSLVLALFSWLRLSQLQLSYSLTSQSQCRLMLGCSESALRQFTSSALVRFLLWNSFLSQLTLFCGKYDIHVPMMEGDYLAASRKRCGRDEVTNLHHYRAELFYTVLDMQLQELNDRFTVTTTELLVCVACLSPTDLFSAFDKEKLIRLASFYPNDFSTHECMVLEDQLDSYVYDMCHSSDFVGLRGLGELAQKLIQTKRSAVYPLIYRLLKLALVLPVATASVERAFSALKIVKSRLRNRMGDQFLNDSLLVYIEKKRFNDISNDAIIDRFQKMKSRRGQL